MKEEIIKFLQDSLRISVIVDNESYSSYYDEGTTVSFKIRVKLQLDVDGETLTISESSDSFSG